MLYVVYISFSKMFSLVHIALKYINMLIVLRTIDMSLYPIFFILTQTDMAQVLQSFFMGELANIMSIS